jgi:hypothetical protein
MESTKPPFATRVPFFRYLYRFGFRRMMFVIAAVATLVALVYAVENWRGKRAWEKCKRELTAKGAKLDWEAHIPAPVPDEQNIYKAPKIGDWFQKTSSGRSTNELQTLLRKISEKLDERAALAKVTVLLDEAEPPPDADIVLRLEDFVLKDAATSIDVSKDVVLPFVKIDDAPVRDAIKYLAEQANIAYTLDPAITFGTVVPGESAPEPQISFRWENVTARQAFRAVLENNDLQFIANPETGVGIVANRNPEKPRVMVEASVRQKLSDLLEKVEKQGAVRESELMLEEAFNFALVNRPANQNDPADIVIRSECPLMDKEIAACFGHIRDNLGRPLRITGSNDRDQPPGYIRLDVAYITPLHYDCIAAGDYLEASRAIDPILPTLREALVRHHARLDGNYGGFESPFPDAIAIRNVAYTLAKRAKCYLLLGDSERALQELTLLHDLRRFIPAQPRFLVSAMIDASLIGLYQSVLANGLKLGVWRDEQLVVLSEQLQNVDVVSRVHESLQCEASAICHLFEHTSMKSLEPIFVSPDRTSKSWFFDVISNPMLLFYRYAPRGWVYQNMAVVARLEHNVVEAFDPPAISPQRILMAEKEVEKTSRRFAGRSPYTVFTKVAIPNLTKAAQNSAWYQTLANQALIACALERYRLEQKAYPETLDALMPRFIKTLPVDVIGGQALKYRRIGETFLLYSIGWNEKDDNGMVAKGGTPAEQGDWVWPGSKI